MSVLKIRDLYKSYKVGFIPRSQPVLKGVNLTIEPGGITGFLGGNGAGKTTTMKCILGLAFADSGSIEFFDGKPISSEVKSRIGFLPERPYFYDYLTGQEFLSFYGEISGRFKKKSQLKERINFLLQKVDLEHARDKQLRGYSKGMLQKIGLAQALIHNPDFVILDEPMAGLDPDGRYYLSELIQETAKLGTAIFFSSHLLHDTERLCEKLVILKDGHVIYEGKTKKLVDQMTSKSEVEYLKTGERHKDLVDDGAPLQAKIDEIRKSGAEIVSVKPDLMSLEEAFIDLAMRKPKK